LASVLMFLHILLSYTLLVPGSKFPEPGTRNLEPGTRNPEPLKTLP
jgi:hypothetical protein